MPFADPQCRTILYHKEMGSMRLIEMRPNRLASNSTGIAVAAEGLVAEKTPARISVSDDGRMFVSEPASGVVLEYQRRGGWEYSRSYPIASAGVAERATTMISRTAASILLVY